MALETVTHISDLVATNPVNGDAKSQGPNHFHIIKSALLTDFPGVTGVVTPTHTELNYVDGVTSAIQTQIDGKAGLASPAFTGVPTVPTAAAGTNTSQAASTAFVIGQAFSSAVPVAAPDSGKFLTNDGTVISWDALPVVSTIVGISGTTAEFNTALSDGSFATLDGVETHTNKRTTPRVGPVASSATPTINTDNYDIFQITDLAVAITSMTSSLTGTPTEGQALLIEITGTAARAITWGASFEASTVALPTTTVTTAKLSCGFLWNSVTSKWRLFGAA